MDPVEEIKARINIVDLVSRYAPLRRMGAVYKCNCPFHNERTPSFVVYPNEGRWHCFGACATGGDIFSFIMKKENKDFREALEQLAQEAGVSLEERGNEDAAKRATLYEVNDVAAGFFQHLLLTHPGAQTARDYLARRSMDAETIESFRIGYAPDQWTGLRDYMLNKGYSLDLLLEAGLIKQNDERTSTYDVFRGRITIPIRERTGRIIGFGGRVLDDSQPKYLNTSETPVFHKSYVVYGIDKAQDAIRKEDRVVIVEGYMDVIAAHQHGFANVVACMGTALTPEQLRQLQRYTSRFVLALDADAAGTAATVRGLRQSRQALVGATKEGLPAFLPNNLRELTVSLWIVALEGGKDPDDIIRSDPQKWMRMVDDAIPLLEFYFNHIFGLFDANTIEGKGQIVAELAPLIAELEDEVKSEPYTQRLARMVRIDEKTIRDQVEAARNIAKRRVERDRSLHRRATTPGLRPSTPPDAPEAESETQPEAQSKAQRRRIDSEDHVLGLLLSTPDLLVLITNYMEEISEIAPTAQDFDRAENREIFDSLKHFLAGDDLWDLELFQDRLAPPLHGILGEQLAFASMHQLKRVGELQETIIKDIFRLRRNRLNKDYNTVQFLFKDAQDNGETDAILFFGKEIDRIARELGRVQPLALTLKHPSAPNARRTNKSAHR